MSKKRLYEIAKELGKESKEVVARAKELGLEVKSHASSVEEALAAKIVASFKPIPKQKEKPKTVAPKQEEVKETTQAGAPEQPKTDKVVARPQSRNFKAEREARAKEQAERRKQNRGNNREQQQNGNRQKKQITVMVGNLVKGNRDNRRFNDQGKKPQGQGNRGNEHRQQEDNRPKQGWTSC